MPALAPQEETKIITRRAATRGARSVSPRTRGAQTRGVERNRDSDQARVLAPLEEQEEVEAPREEIILKTRRRVHRDLKVSLTVGFFSFLIFSQLIALLFFYGMTLTASHRAAKLGDATNGEIGRVNDEIALTQKQIAALGSPAQIKSWADAKGWKMASPQSFDDIRHSPPPQAASPPESNDTTGTDNGTKR